MTNSKSLTILWVIHQNQAEKAVPGRLSIEDPVATWLADSRKIMKTQGEIEAAICSAMCRFEQEYMGRGPKDVHTYLIEELVVVRLQGVLTAAEQQLVRTQPPEKGRDLLKQVRTHLIETARRVMEAMVYDVTSVRVKSLHHDISTITGEKIIIFTLAKAPHFRASANK